MDDKGMAKAFGMMFGLMVLVLVLASLWQSVPYIKNGVHAVLDPTIGSLLNWNLAWGMTILVFFIAAITTAVQKYATDQDALRELKKEQKELQQELKQYKDDPQKMMEMNKKNMSKNLEITGKIMSITMKGSVFTIIPFILLFRWFMDYFSAIPDFRFFGFMTWFWYYLIFVMIFSGFLRKWMKAA